ncbi:MAG TPA: methyltransferase domain-containing protein [Bryobacteraceae bacterium]|nr:methyltransferase domain-containing protein [Bryobacteraceae bacterium]
MNTPRVLHGELLDSLPPGEEGVASLRDLVSINRFLGGHRVIRSVFRRLERSDSPFSVVDVGAASGDMGAALRRAFPLASVTSVDRVPYHLAGAAPPRVVADVFALPFPPRSFDYVTCTLFLHHFSDAALPGLLGSLLGLARRALVVIDLERGPGGRLLMPVVGALFRWSPVTRHDAALSMDSAFRAGELRVFARAAGASDVRIRTHRPWLRLSMVARP